MGLTYHEAKLLLESYISGISFENTLVIACQSLCLYPRELRALRKIHNKGGAERAEPLLSGFQSGTDSGQFFREFLGVTPVFMDYSAYEGATIIHDLNHPIPEDLQGRFDVVVEGGTIEHVFNFPIAIANLMRMVKVGGTLFLSTPANNFCGHGFYQFSPELMYRIFAAENGFEMKRIMFLKLRYPGAELSPMRSIYEVADPAKLGRRVGLMSKTPVLMLVEARKVSEAPLFATMPLQSDYVSAWNGRDGASGNKIKALLKKVERKLPRWLGNRLRGEYLRWHYSFSNSRFYKKI